VDYDQSERPFLFTGELDTRLPAMMRVVGVILGGETAAYPYAALYEAGVINTRQGGQEIVIFHRFGTNSALGAKKISEAEDVGATGVFSRLLDGRILMFAVEDERIVDSETGSIWNLAGQAVEGELKGARLERIQSTDHFWFSWAAFYPETVITGSD
jgi:hypothetical protein